MTITNVQLLSVPVADQDRARDFYVDTLGFTLVSDTQMGADMRWVMVAPPGAQTGAHSGAQTAITLVTWFDSMPAGSLRGLVLESSDLEADVAELNRLGVDIPGGIEQQPWGRFVQFSDSEGNGIVLQQSAAQPPVNERAA